MTDADASPVGRGRPRAARRRAPGLRRPHLRLRRRRRRRASRSSTSSGPRPPRLQAKFTAEGTLTDARDVVVGSTNASLFAYVADGRNGLKVIQLTAPDTPAASFYGFSPRAQAAADRVARDALARRLALVQGPRPRPRRRRDRRPDRGLRPDRLAALHVGGDRSASTSTRRQRVDGEGRRALRGLCSREDGRRQCPRCSAAEQAVRNIMQKTAIWFAKSGGLRHGARRGAIVRPRRRPPRRRCSARHPAGTVRADSRAVARAVHPPLPYQVTDTSLGVVNCASEPLPRRGAPCKDCNVLQNEYVTWSRVDKHATRAYKALLQRALAPHRANLGLTAPPERAKVCLDCHADIRRQRSAASASR